MHIRTYSSLRCKTCGSRVVLDDRQITDRAAVIASRVAQRVAAGVCEAPVAPNPAQATLPDADIDGEPFSFVATLVDEDSNGPLDSQEDAQVSKKRKMADLAQYQGSKAEHVYADAKAETEADHTQHKDANAKKNVEQTHKGIEVAKGSDASTDIEVQKLRRRIEGQARPFLRKLNSRIFDGEIDLDTE